MKRRYHSITLLHRTDTFSLFVIDAIKRDTWGATYKGSLSFEPTTYKNYYQRDGEGNYNVVGGELSGAENVLIRNSQHTMIDNQVAGRISDQILEIVSGLGQ